MGDIIKGRLPIINRLKHGAKIGGMPKKLDYMYLGVNVTTKEGYILDELAMKAIADNFKAPINGKVNSEDKLHFIPINLMYDDPLLNMRTYYTCFDGRKAKGVNSPFRVCKSDGICAKRMMENGDIIEMSCPGPDKCPGMVYKSASGNLVKICKLQGVMDFELRGIGLMPGGVCRYRTTGWNSAGNLLGFMQWIKHSVGILRGLPLGVILTENTTQAMDGKTYQFYSTAMVLQNDEGKDMLGTLAFHKQAELAKREAAGFNMDELQREFAGQVQVVFEEDDTLDASDYSDPDETDFRETITPESKTDEFLQEQAKDAEQKKQIRARAKKAQAPAQDMDDCFPEQTMSLPGDKVINITEVKQ